MSQAQLDTIVGVLRARAAQRPKSVDGLREEFETNMAAMPLHPDARREDVEVAGRAAAWFSGRDSLDDKVVLYLHGGGYVIGSIDTHAVLTERLALAAHARVLSIDYRLAPEHRFPAAVEDATAAYRWLMEQGYAADDVIVAGDSAGGGLALGMLVALRDAGDPLPAAAVLLSPWVDLEAIGDSMTTRVEEDPIIQPDQIPAFAHLYLGRDTNPRHPLAAPLYADLNGLPPLLIHVGTAEVLLDDATRIAERARAHGVSVQLDVWDDMFHVWHMFAPLLDEAQEAVDKVAAFMRLHF